MKTSVDGSTMKAVVTVANPTNSIAFFVRPRIVTTGGDVLPITWSDNMFTLLQNETREVTATFDVKNLKGAQPSLVVEVWNNISGGN